ncbi:hypothetical protein AG1IA_01049 [Rhizoctonia solani AG-1 IA]|uniref:Uncharacterized protein n=1 Tax=Thanatephorus cucumeris (strain AG1-IA) TaxID=983506 RepID=L8X3P9_THACA|nr:hypothetical protein AG1IA_01049 [Rhizoctonia solani AG-1 IA]
MVSRLTTSGIDQEIAGSSPAVAAWRNGIASDYDLYQSGDCRFEPCGGHFDVFMLIFIPDTFEPPLPPVWISRPSFSRDLARQSQTTTGLCNYDGPAPLCLKTKLMLFAIFDTMLEDMVLGIALDEHKAGMRTRAVCAICHMRYATPGIMNTSAKIPKKNTSISAQILDFPEHPTRGTLLSMVMQMAGPIVMVAMRAALKGSRYQWQTASNIVSTRYASHLATCMGLGNARRAGPRNAASKARASTESGPATPTQRSGSVNSEDVPPPVPATKPKPSKKKKSTKPNPKFVTSDTTNENNKREGALPAKTAKSKKQKVGKGVNKAANGKPLAFQPSDLEEFATVRYCYIPGILTYTDKLYRRPLLPLPLPESRRPQCLAYLLSSKILKHLYHLQTRAQRRRLIHQRSPRQQYLPLTVPPCLLE